jgi:hypothetical protein
MTEMTKVRPRRMIVSRFQGIVRDSIVVEGMLKGIPLDGISKQLSQPPADS